MFATIPAIAPDPLYEVGARFAADPRPQRIDLGVGVYRDEDGRSPVMAAVKRAEATLLETQSSKAYRPLLGDPRFVSLMSELAVGADNPVLREKRLVAIQTAGGTGALRLAAALVSSAKSDAVIHLGTPTWPSHAGIFAVEGVNTVEHPYWEAGQTSPMVEAISRAANLVSEGDVFLFHGPCHNPTGIDLTRAERRDLTETVAARGGVPLLDIAYYGLADGLDIDLDVVRDLLSHSRRAFVALSCSKAFGLYRERTGILLVLCDNAAEAGRVRDRISRLSRLMVSSPPAHGAEVVATILDDPAMTMCWRDELGTMRERISQLRITLAESGLAALAPLREQRGIFAMLPLDPTQVRKLGQDHAIHMPTTGRANLVGLGAADIVHFLHSLEAVGLK